MNHPRLAILIFAASLFAVIGNAATALPRGYIDTSRHTLGAGESMSLALTADSVDSQVAEFGIEGTPITLPHFTATFAGPADTLQVRVDAVQSYEGDIALRVRALRDGCLMVEKTFSEDEMAYDAFMRMTNDGRLIVIGVGFDYPGATCSIDSKGLFDAVTLRSDVRTVIMRTESGFTPSSPSDGLIWRRYAPDFAATTATAATSHNDDSDAAAASHNDNYDAADASYTAAGNIEVESYPTSIATGNYDAKNIVVAADPKSSLWQMFDYQVESRVARPGGRYTLATVPVAEGGYDLVYISGAEICPDRWHPGDVKGHLAPTPFISTYNLEWIDAEGNISVDPDAYATFTDSHLILTFPRLSATIRLVRPLP